MDSEKTSSTKVVPRDVAPGAKEREAVIKPLVAVILAWALPGGGHFYLGRRIRAVVFCTLILFSLLLGFALDGKLHRMVSDQPLSTLATLSCMGVGAPYFMARFLFRYAGDLTSPGYEYGSAFILTAGLMNLLLILDAWDISRGRKE